jgi:hypothetical protein
MGKMSLGVGRVTVLGNSDEEWKAIKCAAETQFIRALDEWDDFVSSGEIKDSVLGELDRIELMVFRNYLQFGEVTRNGRPFQRGISTWYYGDLAEKHGFREEQLVKVAGLFGIGPERFLATRDKFGDICNGDVCCRSRPNFNCPDGKPDCSC